MPAKAIAVAKAVGPGIISISKKFSLAILINSLPGSEIHGIPASLTSAIFFF